MSRDYFDDCATGCTSGTFSFTRSYVQSRSYDPPPEYLHSFDCKHCGSMMTWRLKDKPIQKCMSCGAPRQAGS